MLRTYLKMKCNEHYSVLLNEAIQGLNIKSNGIYLDATLGRAGHSKVILKNLKEGRLVGIDQDDEALEYFKRSAEGKGRHAEAMFAYCAICVNDFGSRVYAPELKRYFEQAAKDGVLEAQYNYGLGLLKESNEIQDRRHGVEVLSWAAKEILLRRQCKSVQIQTQGRPCTFFYSPLPQVLTRRATDNYIWEHFSENIAKMDRTPMCEILHPVIPIMVPQRELSSLCDSPKK